jgi:TrmH family RNA methyltransferase
MITSTSNPTIKLARSLREKKTRLESGLFFIEGLRIVTEACQQRSRVETILYSPELLVSDWGKHLIQEQGKLGVHLLECDEKVFRSLSSKEGPQGLSAIVHQNLTPIEKLMMKDGNLYVALDSVQDPGNLGTILRTADAAGANGVILLDQSTDPYDPTAVRASMGAIFDQVLVKASLEMFGDWKKKYRVSMIGTSGTATMDYHEFAFPSTLILLMGSEKKGLRKVHYELCDNVVKIPMLGKSDSLNIAVATAVVLYEIFNQQRAIRIPVMGKGKK